MLDISNARVLQVYGTTVVQHSLFRHVYDFLFSFRNFDVCSKECYKERNHISHY